MMSETDLLSNLLKSSPQRKTTKKRSPLYNILMKKIIDLETSIMEIKRVVEENIE